MVEMICTGGLFAIACELPRVGGLGLTALSA
jgi:hypothetical protein